MSSRIPLGAAVEKIGRIEVLKEPAVAEAKPAQLGTSNYPPKTRFADSALPHSHRAVSA